MDTINELHLQSLKYNNLARHMYWLSFVSRRSYRKYHDAQIEFMKASMDLASSQKDGAWIDSPMELSKFYASIAKTNEKYRNHLIISKEYEIRPIYGGRSVC